MNKTKNILLLALIGAIFIAFNSLYMVNEHEKAIVLRFGKLQTINGDYHLVQPGLSVKLPFVDVVKKFDTRLQSFNVHSSRIVTLAKKDLLVDYYIKWKIRDIPTFYKATGANRYRIESLIRQKANDVIRAEFGKRTIKEVVSGERRDIMEYLKKYVDKSTEELGVDIIDFRTKRIDLPKEVSDTVFSRMRSERNRVATEHRAEGHAKSEAIKAKADADAKIIEAKAQKESQTIKAKADAKAAQIYAKAYDKNPEFYSMYRSFLAYIKSFDSKNDVMIMPLDGKFFEQMQLENK